MGSPKSARIVPVHAMTDVTIRALTVADWPQVAAIYGAGIDTGV